MIFKAKALSDLLQAKHGLNTYNYHQVLRALEGNPHGLTKQELASLRDIIKNECSKLCKKLK